MMTDDDERKLTVMLVEMSTKLEILLDKQEELADNISKIKEAVYNPDSGLFARLKELDIRIIQLETWKAANTRVMWLVGGSVAGLLVKTAWTVLFP
jgi:uncharacterized protein YigA (DUF484 family)|tara:strand:- start:292 stop:579 length:288 start_codon:yes stop_codon:yes gene_type:complete